MPAAPALTLVIARFEDLLARGLRGLVDSDPSLETVADGIEPERIDVVLRAHHPRVAILDVDALPNLAAVREISHRHPDTRLVLLAGRPTEAVGAQLLAFGASACLDRNTQSRDILTAIHLASRGLQVLPRRLGAPSAGPRVDSGLLTQRESDVLPLLQQGSSNAQIAAALHVGIETVRTHARNIYRKLGVSSRRELAALPLPSPDDHPAGGADPEPARRRARSGPGRSHRRGSLRR